MIYKYQAGIPLDLSADVLESLVKKSIVQFLTDIPFEELRKVLPIEITIAKDQYRNRQDILLLLNTDLNSNNKHQKNTEAEETVKNDDLNCYWNPIDFV